MTVLPVPIYDNNQRLKQTIPAHTRVYIGTSLGQGLRHIETEDGFGSIQARDIDRGVVLD